MELLLEELEPLAQFPGIIHYRHKLDGFIYSNHLAGPKFWQNHGNNFEAREDDVYIASLPRTGTTWTTEIVYLILNDLDYAKAKQTISEIRAPYLNFVETPLNAFDILSPRCIRTHLLYNHLPECIKDKKCRIIYTYRNPKDTLVSYYNFCLMNKFINFVGDFNDMFNLFIQEKLNCGPYWMHILSFWEHRHKDNILLISYEENKRDPITSLKKICKFLGKEFSDEELNVLAEHTSFDSMKRNPSVNYEHASWMDREKSDFIRKGKVGDWKNYMSQEQNERMDEYVRKYFQGTGVEFECEI